MTDTIATHERNGRLIASYDDFAGVHTWNFTNGEVMTFDMERLAGWWELREYPLLQQAAMHGVKQRIGDAAAIARDTATGLPASRASKIAAMRRIAAALESGQWELERAAGGGVGKGGKLATAIATVRGKPLAVVTEWLRGKSAGERAELRKVPEVAAELARMVGEVGAYAADLLAELE